MPPSANENLAVVERGVDVHRLHHDAAALEGPAEVVIAARSDIVLPEFGAEGKNVVILLPDFFNMDAFSQRSMAEGLLCFQSGVHAFMNTNQFENSRVADGTMLPGAQHNGLAGDESRAISRDDVRDGFAPPEDAQAGTRRILTASTLTGDRVRNSAGDDLGNIEEIMLDLDAGRIAYAVLSFGGFLGIGDKLFAVPWSALRVDQGEHEFVLDVDRAALEKAPGFDKDNWPDMADPAFGRDIYEHYRQTPYWEHTVTDAGDYTGEKPVADRSGEYEPTVTYRAGTKH